jgi:hypothetical protein
MAGFESLLKMKKWLQDVRFSQRWLYLLGYHAMYPDEIKPTLLRNVSPPSSSGVLLDFIFKYEERGEHIPSKCWLAFNGL